MLAAGPGGGATCDNPGVSAHAGIAVLAAVFALGVVLVAGLMISLLPGVVFADGKLRERLARRASAGK